MREFKWRQDIDFSASKAKKKRMDTIHIHSPDTRQPSRPVPQVLGPTPAELERCYAAIADAGANPALFMVHPKYSSNFHPPNVNEPCLLRSLGSVEARTEDLPALVVRAEKEPGTEAVFLFDNTPAHHRAEAVVLATSEHSIKRLPPYSLCFNQTEEVFSKFKAGVKTFLPERQDELFTTPQGITKKQHCRELLVEAAGESMQHILPVEYAAYDRHNYTFGQAALECHDM
ncbi:hypothetical protein HPB49_009463 [Dermacentor silvarum]|uniref:Uncharacterized protein n=1 Tax=Dermacentor silvarum TaxID=543639 RepID=A0ACB8D470_DERSI|nr:hypothetical protein HPB49_009463 [Dermacentor silvarum]